MNKSDDKPSLVFVYNADSGLFNTLTDIAHKIFSPDTYSCNLCMITHDNLSMRSEWKDFIEKLDIELEFLHRDLEAVLQGREGRSKVGDGIGLLEIPEFHPGQETLQLMVGVIDESDH